MSMKKKIWLFLGLYILGGIPLIILTAEYSNLPFILWILLFAVGQFFIFHCPHCSRNALFLKYWIPDPLFIFRNRCVGCDKEY